MNTLKASVLFLALSLSLNAQENVTYQKPSAEILQLADYERAPSVMMNGDRDWMVLLYRDTYMTLEELSREELKLGGLRIDPKTNITSSVTYSKNMKVKRLKDAKEVQVKGLPDNAKLTNFSFSPDDKKLAFTNTASNGVELWVVDLESATAKKITKDNLNANLGSPYDWLKNSDGFIIKTLPENRPDLIDKTKDLPNGPIVSTSDGKVSQNRTYQDLLKNPQDEYNFEILATSELYKVDLSGNLKKFKDKGMYDSSSFSPDGKYLMISSIQKPFSYIVPYYRFPELTEVYDVNGNLVKTVNEVPLNETMPKGFSSVRTGKRNMFWKADEPATLVFAEALDGGDQGKTAEYRDEVFVWQVPFNTEPKSIFKTKQRYNGISFSNGDYAIVSDSWYDTRNTKTYLLNTKNGDSKIIEDRNYQDIYSDPGNFNKIKNQYGRSVIDIQNGKALLVGDGYTKEGQFPFIDEFDFATLKKNRLYTSKIKDKKEDFVDILDAKRGEILVTQQSAKDYPNYYVRNIKSGKVTPVTQFENPFSGLNNVYKEVITYKRNDGVTLTGTLYLPAGYDRKTKKEKLPLLIWAYPREYKDKNRDKINAQRQQYRKDNSGQFYKEQHQRITIIFRTSSFQI